MGRVQSSAHFFLVSCNYFAEVRLVTVMKYITYILVAVFIILMSTRVFYAQQKTPPNVEWKKSFGGSRDDGANDIQQTSDGGFIVVGYSGSENGDVIGGDSSTNYWVIKLSVTGVIEWQKSLGGSESDVAYSIRQTNDSGYIIGGASLSRDGNVTGHHGQNAAGLDFWIVKLTKVGEIDWERSYGGDSRELCQSVIQTYDGGYIAAGESHSTDGDVSANHSKEDYWVVKITDRGAIEWERSFGGSDIDISYSIEQARDSGFIIAGGSYSLDGDVKVNQGFEDFWILKLSSTGILEWERSFGGTSYDRANSVEQTIDGGYIAAGYSSSMDGDVTNHHGDTKNTDYWVVKLTSSGQLEWQRSFGGSDLDYARCIRQTSDGGYILAGESWSNDGDVTGHHNYGYSTADIWIVKLSSEGNIQWQKSLGGGDYEMAYSIRQTNDGGYIIAGSSESINGDVQDHHGNDGVSDFWVVKLGPETPSSVETELATTRTATITPNPASSSATLTLDSDEEGACEVQIISVTGATLKQYSTRLTTGKQEIALTDLESLPSGMYEVIVKRSCCQTLRTKLIVQ